MARKREYDPEAVLEQAMQLFWSQGYEATSLADLTGATGLSKSSLYDAFPSKHALFLAALERYDGSIIEDMVRRLDEARLPRAALTALLVAVANGSMYRDQRGCLLANAAMELGPRDADAHARIARSFARLEDAIYRTVRRAQQAGEIDRARDARRLAGYILSAINGLRVSAKVTPDRLRLNATVQVTLAALD